MNEEDLLKMPTDNHLSSYEVAEQFVTNATEAYKEFWRIIKVCQNHIAGEKPISPEKLKAKKLGWVWNFNYHKARGKIEKGVAESTAKISSALAMGYVSFRNFKESDKEDDVLRFLENPEQRGMVASAIGAAFASMLSKESRLSGWLNEVEYPSYAFGYCALLFDMNDWMPDPVHPLAIAFEPNTRPEEINSWVTFKTLKANFLYDKWVKIMNGSESSWSKEGLESVLKNAFGGKIRKNGNEVTPETWEEIIPVFRENPAYVIGSTNDVSIAKIFYKELDGTLTETYIPWQNNWNIPTNRTGLPKPENPNTNKILFQKNHGPYIQSEKIGLIRDSGFSETGCIQDYRGIAKFAVEDSIRYNRARNQIGNKMTFIGSPFFESEGTQQNDNMKLTVAQGYICLPSTHRLAEKQPTLDIASHINVLRFEEGEYMRDTQQYDASVQGRLSSRPNKDEVRQISQEVQVTNSAKNNIKLKDYATIFLSVLKKIATISTDKANTAHEGRVRFFEILKRSLNLKTDADVKKVIAAVDSFVLEPVIGDESAIMMGIQMAETPFARNRLKRMLLISKGFPIEEVNIMVPLMTDNFANLQDERMALIENDMFFTTNEVVALRTDDHIIHLDAHFNKAGRVIQGFQQQALTAMVAFKYLENILAHTLTHIEMLGEDPAFNQKAQEYMESQNAFAKQKNQIMAIAEREMQEEQARAQQIEIDPKTQADIARENIKTQADLQRKNTIAVERTEQREKQMQLTHEQRMHEIELENERKMLNGK